MFLLDTSIGVLKWAEVKTFIKEEDLQTSCNNNSTL